MMVQFLMVMFATFLIFEIAWHGFNLAVFILKIILKNHCPQPLPSTASMVKIKLDGKKGIPMQVKDQGQPVTATIELDDALGNVVTGAALDASPAPVWGLDDASFGTLAPSADGLSCVLTPSGKLGVCHMQLSASLGGKAVTAVSDDINVVAGDAVSIKMKLS